MENEQLSTYEKVRSGGDGKGKGVVKPEDMQLLQERLFENLVYFDEFCNRFGLAYCLAEGTCLGAVREHDFIPWDDDLDVGMPRKDYDRLFELWEEFGDKNRFSLYRTTQDFCAYVPIGLLRNNSTTYIRDFEGNLKDRNLGVKIDIAPIDELSDNLRKRKIQRYAGLLYVLFLTQRKPRVPRKKKYINTIANILLSVIRNKRIRQWIVKKTEIQVTKYNGQGHTFGAFNGIERNAGLWKMNDINKRVRMMFHGKEFFVPLNYDEYLTRVYGDYMCKPPVEKRLPLDTPLYYDLNKPCLKQNG